MAGELMELILLFSINASASPVYIPTADSLTVMLLFNTLHKLLV